MGEPTAREDQSGEWTNHTSKRTNARRGAAESEPQEVDNVASPIGAQECVRPEIAGARDAEKPFGALALEIDGMLGGR